LLSLLDFDIIDSIVYVLKPLQELTDILAAEKRVSVSAVKPLVQSICNNMLAINDEDTDLAKDMKARIKCDLLQRYSEPEIDKLLSKCSFVDPQFKKRLCGDAKLTTIVALKSEVMAFEEGGSDQEVTTVSMEPPRKRSALSRILDDEIEQVVPSQNSCVERVEHVLTDASS